MCCRVYFVTNNVNIQTFVKFMRTCLECFSLQTYCNFYLRKFPNNFRLMLCRQFETRQDYYLHNPFKLVLHETVQCPKKFVTASLNNMIVTKDTKLRCCHCDSPWAGRSGIESRWGRSFHTRPEPPLGPISFPYNG